MGVFIFLTEIMGWGGGTYFYSHLQGQGNFFFKFLTIINYMCI